jgi:hypothetical protein
MAIPPDDPPNIEDFVLNFSRYSCTHEEAQLDRASAGIFVDDT